MVMVLPVIVVKSTAGAFCFGIKYTLAVIASDNNPIMSKPERRALIFIGWFGFRFLVAFVLMRGIGVTERSV